MVASPLRAYGPWDARQQRSFRYCYSEADIRRAIGDIATKARFTGLPADPDVLVPQFGQSIVLVGPIGLSAPITIPAKVGGLSIVGGGGFLFPKAVIAAAFIVQARFISIENVSTFTIDTSRYFETFVSLEDTATYDAPGYLDIIGCHALGCDRLVVAVDTGTDNVIVERCRQTKVSGSTSAPVVFKGNHCVLRDCKVSDGGGDGVTLAAGASDCIVVGNNLSGADITSSASSGSNVIMGNVNTGTLTNHAADAVGLNT